MPHHPFRREDVPYMQAYSPVLLDNDYHTFDLLRRINPHNSPSFHDYGKKPPASVLDLGCGEGFWVLSAAKAWRWAGTQVTGFDLIDLHRNYAGEVRPEYQFASVPENVTWRRGNFVKYALPYPDETFDLVRMANLALCIPQDRWFFVLAQAHRVLKPGGKLEIIDDQLFFPQPQVPVASSPTQRSPTSKEALSLFDSDSDEEEVVIGIEDSDDPFAPLRPVLADKAVFHRLPRDIRPDPVSHRHRTNVEITKLLERLFEKMLNDKYQINPRPEEFVEDALHDLFGAEEDAMKTQEFHLAVPPRGVFEDKHIKAKRPRQSYDSVKQNLGTWLTTVDWDEKPKSVRREDNLNTAGLGGSPVREMRPVTPKAAQLLFGDHRTHASRAGVPYQPPGLVLLPTTLLPCAPAELEMHACKHMNVLLGCRHALASFALDHVDADGVSLVSEEELGEFLWDYDRFRRKRFNWPADYPDVRMEEDSGEPSPSSRPASPKLFRFLSNPGSPLSRRISQGSRRGSASAMPPMTEVRAFKVFVATKASVA
ncbi:S-adenosyl-L-methionine-dependent methyltransferase [Amylocystis lapponica]|nr:S-adenosyl-L-methionine-dependent methyltransferase [Amylocystis lapponica]